MKKLVLFLLIGFSVVSCDMGNDDNSTYVLGPVQDVTMATTYKVDSISEIMVRFKRPDDCHLFLGFYYNTDENTRNIALEYAKSDDSNCLADEQVYEVPLQFKPQYAGTYLFRFWDGTNTDGTNHFYEAEAIVNP